MSKEHSAYATAMALRVIYDVGNPDPPKETGGAAFVATLLECGYRPQEIAKAIKTAWSQITSIAPGDFPNFRECTVPVIFRCTFLEALRPGITERNLQDVRRRTKIYHAQDLDEAINYLRETDQEQDTKEDRRLQNAYDQAIANAQQAVTTHQDPAPS